MPKTQYATVVVVAFLVASLAVAGARQDVRIYAEEDSRGHTVYVLVNNGSLRVKVQVSHEKNCRSTTTRRKPTVQEFWLQPDKQQHLRKVLANSDCRHTYKIVSAEYY